MLYYSPSRLALAILLLCTLWLPSRTYAQASLAPMPMWRAFDADGAPLAGGKLYTCVAGASCPGTPKAAYTDSTGIIAHENPIILNANGEAPIWLLGTYKLHLRDSADVPQWTVDHVAGAGFGASSFPPGLAYNPFTTGGTECDQATLITGAAAAQAAGQMLFLPPTNAAGVACDWDITSNLTLVPPLMIPKGAVLNVAATVTLTLAACPDAGQYQIFDADETTTGSVRWVRSPCGEYPVEWWGALADDSTVNTVDIQAAITSVPNGGVLRLRGVYRTGNLVVAHPMGILGDGIYYDHRGPLNSANWNDTTRTFGTILRCVDTTGTCLTLMEMGISQPYNLAHFGLVGPGTGTSNGVQVGGPLTNPNPPPTAGAGQVNGTWYSMAIVNFAGIGLYQWYANEWDTYGTRIMGNGIGMQSDVTGSNINGHFGMMIHNNASHGLICTAGTANAFYRLTIQGNNGYGILANGCSELTIYTAWFEGNTLGAIEQTLGRSFYHGLHFSGINAPPDPVGMNNVHIRGGVAHFQEGRAIGEAQLFVDAGVTVTQLCYSWSTPPSNSGTLIDYGECSGVDAGHLKVRSVTLDAGSAVLRRFIVDGDNTDQGSSGIIRIRNTPDATAHVFVRVSDEADVDGWGLGGQGPQRERVQFLGPNGAISHELDTVEGFFLLKRDAATACPDSRLANNEGLCIYIENSTNKLVFKYLTGGGVDKCIKFSLDGSTTFFTNSDCTP